MAEIKSTLDIIMERTKGMTMSDAEKRAFKQKETTDRVKGLIQKYADGFLDLERLKMDMGVFEPDQQEIVKQTIQGEVLHRIKPGINNHALWDVLEIICGIETAPLMKSLADLEHDLEEEHPVYKKNMEANLKEKGISGSALIPNIESDPDWLTFSSEKEREFQENALKALSIPK